MPLTLAADVRTVSGKKVKVLRRDGKVPAVVYGHGFTPANLTVDRKQLTGVWREAGSSQLVDVTVADQEPVKVLIHDVQVHPVSGTLLHADLYQVKMTEKLETEIPLEFVGEAPAVKDLEGNLITEKDALEVRCLPGDLVAAFEVDISRLKTFEDVIKVKDVIVPATIEVLNDPEEIVALATPPRTEEELEAELAVETGAEAEQAAISDMEAKAEAEKAEAEQAKEAEAETAATNEEK